ncbi:cupredoxin domain-containing protein [Leucobacter albus]|uniref:Cupredoxin domain-containing protein n=1 Tax=Leucobacter albus TaxID=272210 RepID=A0ABW3TML6_9MICO
MLTVRVRAEGVTGEPGALGVSGAPGAPGGSGAPGAPGASAAVAKPAAVDPRPRSPRTLAARVAAGVGAFALALGLAGCSAEKPPVVPSDDDAKVSITVRVIDNSFEPSDITIKAGQAVSWSFEGPSSEHDVVAEDGSFVSELMAEGSYTHVFDEAGSFDYLCSIHPEMRGSITVE